MFSDSFVRGCLAQLHTLRLTFLKLADHHFEEKKHNEVIFFLQESLTHQEHTQRQ